MCLSTVCKGKLAVRRLKYVVFGTWTLVAFFAVNYAVMRVCVSDMGWNVEQRDVIPSLVGTRGFPMLPRVACPRYLAVVVCSATEQRYASRGVATSPPTRTPTYSFSSANPVARYAAPSTYLHIPFFLSHEEL
ncbi:hypothetical protein MRX96_051218 [Rhipicephalus microplus]